MSGRRPDGEEDAKEFQAALQAAVGQVIADKRMVAIIGKANAT